MTRWTVRTTALAAFGATILMVAYSLASLFLPGAELIPDRPSVLDVLAFSIIFTAFPAVGLVVIWNRPANPIGWIFLAIGFGVVMSVFSTEYAGRVIYAGWSHSGVELVAWTGSWTWAVASGLGLTMAVLLFPDGRLPGPRWVPVAWLAGLTIVTLVVAQALRPGALEGYDGTLVNPLGVGGAVGEVAEAIVAPGIIAILALGFVSIASLVVRFRRAAKTERQQLKWFLYPVSLFLVGLTGAAIAQNDLVWTIALLGLAAIPIGAGIAILRHRLFDIDVVINRTLVYATLSVTLGALYVGLVLALQALLSPFTETSSPAVAISTLAVAAAFGPARRFLQSAVDRRFYRARYDARRTLEGFAASLRDEVDLVALTANLQGAAQQTLQPASASVWLRERHR